MKKVLLTTPYGPYDVAWGEDMMDLMSARLARGHDFIKVEARMPAWGLYLIAENLKSRSTVLESPHWDDLMRELARGYDVIGIALKTIDNERVARMVEAIRTQFPATEIVIGGYGVSALDDPLPGDAGGYARYIKDNAHHLCRDEGVGFMRRLLGEPTDRPITQYEMPYAHYHLPGMRQFAMKMPAVLVSLGCPSACEFCNTSAFFRHKKIRIAEPEQTYAFLKHHMDKLGQPSMNAMLFDEDLFLDPDYVRELGRLIRSDRKYWGIRWHTFGSMRAISPFSGEELRACGLGGVWIGVESGLEDGARTGFKKREGAKTPPQVFADLHKHGIETIGSMILGFDFHDHGNIVDDIDYFVSLRPTFYQISPLTPCPGTKLFKRLREEKRIRDDYDHTSFHLWKDDVFKLTNFQPGDIKTYFDLAHEKMRIRNGPPVVQFAAGNLSAWEVLRGSSDPYLRDQAERSRMAALGSMPVLRALVRNPPSPEVLHRVKDIERRARDAGRLAPRGRVIGKVVEMVVDRQAQRLDRLERPPAKSDPPIKWTFYNEPGRPKALAGNVWWEKAKALRRVPRVPELTDGRLRELPAAERRAELPPAAQLVSLSPPRKP